MRLSKRRAGFGMLLVATAACLGACGSSESDDAAAGSTGAASGATRKPKGDASEMVAAVSAKPGQGVVDLKFTLMSRPKVGEPVDIELAMTPSTQLEMLFARFQVAEGLQLVSGGETDHLEHPAPGVPIGHKITVLPKSDGIFYVTAVVLADSEKDSVARTFTIPLIAGQGLTELPPSVPAASVADPRQAPARP